MRAIFAASPFSNPLSLLSVSVGAIISPGHRDSIVTVRRIKHRMGSLSTGSEEQPEPDTLGARILEIRQRLRSERKPLPYKQLAARILKETGVSISSESLRRWELNQRRPDITEAAALVQVDPLHRDLNWLAGDVPKPTQPAEPVVEIPTRALPDVEKLRGQVRGPVRPRDTHRKGRGKSA